MLCAANYRNELEQILTQHHRVDVPVSDGSTAEKAREELVLAIVTHDGADRGSGPCWSLLENDHFKRALQCLKPDFAPPTVRDARQVVFPRLHAATRADIDHFLKSASSLTLVCSTEIVADHKRNIKWFAVDQDYRSELLAIVPNVTTEYPEDIAARIRAFVQQVPRSPTCMLHFCNDSFGASHLARGLLKKHSLGASGGVVFVGGCMMQQTLLLFRDVLETISCVNLALEKCMEVVSFMRTCKPLLRKLQAASSNSQLHPSVFELCVPTPESFHSFIVCVNQVLALKDTIQRVLSAEDSEIASYSSSTSSIRERAFLEAVGDDMFWLCLEYTKEVMKPFAYLMVLSDMGHATSAQLLLCWLLLQNTINFSTMVLEIDKDNFNMMLVDRIRMFSEDHVFACLIFDPRIHGLSLSAYGKRKARLIIADLGTKLNPAMNRAQLVEQLLKYLNKERPFDEEDSWSMMATMPRLFWMEYLVDMPELASVALAVLGFHSYLMPLEETWQTCTQRHRRATARNESLAASLELEQVRLHYSKTQSNAESARKQSLTKYRKCIVDHVSVLLGGSGGGSFVDDLFVDASMPTSSLRLLSDGIGDEESRASDPDHGGDDLVGLGGSSQPLQGRSDDASVSLRQFKYWLQRLDEHEKNLPVDEADSDGSLQRFDAEWLELSPESARQIRDCVEKFVLDRDAGHPNQSDVVVSSSAAEADAAASASARTEEDDKDERGQIADGEDDEKENADADSRFAHHMDHAEAEHDRFDVHQDANSDAIGV